MRRWIPVVVFALLVAAAFGDHYFRDEFYYLACSRRLAWGYVDHPPLSVAILWLITHVAGTSLLALRIAAAAVVGTTVWLAGATARRLGASGFGQTVAMAGTALAPELLSVGSFYSMNVFDVLVWTAAARIFIEILDSPDTSSWVLLGVVLGLGLENKVSVLWLGAGLAAGLILTPARRMLLTRGPWICAAIAAMLFAPHVLWQASHGWPTLEFVRNASHDKMQSNTALGFIAGQVMNMNPVTLPVWLGGLVWLLVTPHARYRPIGLAVLTVAAILIANRTSRSGYLAPAFPVLFAAGGVALETLLRRTAWRATFIAVLLMLGFMTVPFAIPLLPVDQYVAYAGALGVTPKTEEKKALGRLPQFFADRQGWESFVDSVAVAFDRLEPGERPHAAVLVGNYGEAGAIEQLGRSRGLVAISGHNNYWLWGPAGRTGDVLIVVTRSRDRVEALFQSVEQVGETACGDCMPYEDHLPIFICRRMKPPSLSERWNALKHFD